MPARPFTRRGCLLAATMLFLGGALASGADPKPNIVFFLIDDLGYGDVGCYGSDFHETPNIDKLAREGMRFTQGYAACPVCSPTRASIMCGKYPARIRLTNFLKGTRRLKGSPVIPPRNWADQMELEELTIAEALASSGYRTGFFGKWHLGGPEYYPEHQGFDVNVGGTRSGMPRSFFWPRWKGNPPIEGRFEGEYLPDRLAEEAVRFIEENHEKPFLLYLSHYAVHIPIEAKEKKLEKYRKKLEEHPEKARIQSNPHYAAMVESVDDSIGRVLDALERFDLGEKTVVVFTSDNGGLVTPEGKHTPATNLAPLRAGKGYLYEGGVRVPWIVKWPGVTPAGSTCSRPVQSIDFFPTLVEIAGIEEVGTHGPIDGRSIVELLRDPAARIDRPAIFWHYPHFSNQGGRPGGAILAERYKLIERYEDGKLELYDLEADAGEKRNLAEELPEKASELLAMLEAWREEVDAQMPEPNPEVRRRGKATAASPR